MKSLFMLWVGLMNAGMLSPDKVPSEERGLAAMVMLIMIAVFSAYIVAIVGKWLLSVLPKPKGKERQQ